MPVIMSFLVFEDWSIAGASILGDWGVATSRILGRGLWTGREILLYLIMFRKYVRKWWIL